MNINQKFQLLLWFVRRPKFYPQLMDLIFMKMFCKVSSRHDTRREMESWCAERALDIRSAITQLTGIETMTSVDSLYPDIFENSKAIAEACPIKMGGPGDLDLLYWSAEYLKAKRVIETGVAYGWSSLAILLSLKNRTGGKLVSTDMPYWGRNNDPYVGCVVPVDLRPSWEVITNADKQGLPKAIKIIGQIDMCHYDSDKSYEGRMWAYPILWNALRPGGFFISDDVGDNVGFREFANAVKVDPIVIQKNSKYIGVIVKR